MTEIENEFEQRVRSAIKEMHEFKYRPKAFLDMCIDYSTVEAIKRLLRKDDVSSGFTKLWENKRLDLSMENIIQEPKWHGLFTDEDRELARKRLLKYDFEI